MGATPRRSPATAASDDRGAKVSRPPSGDASASAKPSRRSPWIRENLEAITVAIIMALVIRQFCVEAFKIPTGSMAPTLLGGDAGLFAFDDPRSPRPEPVGDRILVNKFVYLLREPSRWDVIVFKYPLNVTRNFIKRLVGLPGETLEIRDGDLWVDGSLERKPRWLQRSLWNNWPIWIQGECGPFSKRFSAEDGDAARWTESGDAVVVSGGAPSYASFRGALVDATNGIGLRNAFVGDIRLTVEAEPAGGSGGGLACEIRDGASRYEFLVPVGSGAAKLSIDGEVVAEKPGAVLKEGRPTEVSFENVDDTLVLTVGGDEVLVHAYDSGDEGLDRRAALRFGTTGPQMSFTGIAVHRDIYYTNAGVLSKGRTVQVPEGRLFALGDNSPESKDSRLWESRTYDLSDGRVVTGDPGEAETFRREGSRIRIADVYGESHVFDESAIARQRPDEYAPFIPRKNVMGKAFFVFWPITHRSATYTRFWGSPPDSSDGIVFNPKFIK